LDEDSVPPGKHSSDHPIRVTITNEVGVDLPLERIEAAVLAALVGADQASVEVGVAIVDDATIQELNQQFLEHDYPTDVLSFPLEDTESCLQGEIVVSIETAARCAVDVDWSALDELLLYVVHGALHLAGYRDKEPHEIREMRSREAAILQEMGVKLSAQDSRWHHAVESEDGSR
jgi:probable rRNA maturation factor